MKMKIFFMLAILATFLINAEAKKKKKTSSEPTISLSEKGEALKLKFEKTLETLKVGLVKELPQIDENRRKSYFIARTNEVEAESMLKSAQKEHGKIKRAQGLVGHAKNHWIGKAEKGIKAAGEKISQAKSAEEKRAAEDDLAKWEKSKKEGLQALKERESGLKEVMAEEPKLKVNLEKAKAELEQAKAETMKAVKSFDLDELLSEEKLDAKLLKYQLISDSTPEGLAAYAQNGKREEELLEQFFNNEEMMFLVTIADGPKGGKLGEALDIYSEIQAKSVHTKDGIFKKLALAISLEHAVPVKQRNPVAMEDAPEHVDPVSRYLNYEKAFLAEELDPAFEEQSIWALRMVIDGYEPDDTLAWGREMLRNYRPDHISMNDYRWRYVAAVRTDIRYGSGDNKYDQPELQFFQNILKNGGICGRRAFFGRFMLRSFGVPTTARPQPGHAALAHWTPDGWVVCLGGGWGAGSTKTRYKKDLDFLANTQAREYSAEYVKVKRAQWLGTMMGEKPVYGLYSGSPGMWYGISLYLQKDIIETNKAKALAAVGEDIGEANESKVKEKVNKVNIESEERRVSVFDDGSILIPAVSCVRPTNNTPKIKFMKSVLGGMQLHYERTGKGKETFEYAVDIPNGGEYLLSSRVVTPSWKQHLLLAVNGSDELVDIPLPYTIGMWGETEPVRITLKKGKNTLVFSRQEDRLKGITVKDFRLTPIKKT